ncbi:hypothetical protein NBO_53g0014 [Nosema bombycis CQ1]|jgi:hypothetical protein|uniref:Uncharacterized protein n=1 Tax=Nosema bombycis (strain CQ1 / CVCC 102059) TaxID=578461 RepID=R0MID3_NOSB1|nr:hypothetical protein NBO_1219gi001 [Nosema bombycis CQ1]EOB13890.1 hypothetical protein NBO_53g0014 [Nosema bombycis CQ1]|eukprot:EOB11396.1 hypothetical protein NBO_1219gi001 [Nosema bombycis CQ1]
MGRRYDIVQTPKGIRLSDLPGDIKIGVPFGMNGEMYICEKTGVSGLKVCTEEENGRLQANASKHYFVIRKM